MKRLGEMFCDWSNNGQLYGFLTICNTDRSLKKDFT